MQLTKLKTHSKSEDVDKNMDMMITGDGILHLVFDKLIITVVVENGKAAINSVVDNQGD